MADPRDIKQLAMLQYYEARGEGAEGMKAVGWTAMNRLNKPVRFGSTLSDVITQPYQFTGYNPDVWAGFNENKLADADRKAWNQSLQISSGILNGSIPDPTEGADHYLNPKETKKQNRGRLPKWTRVYPKTTTIGRHDFYKSND